MERNHLNADFYVVQLVTDFLCAKFRNIDYRKSIIVSEVTSALGLMGLAFVPGLFHNPLIGILLCVTVYAVGSGLIEVLCSPIIEACPFPNKEGMMSLLHSFYCWGAVGVILGSTLFFTVFGLDNWRILACLWALIPLYNIVNFAICPIEPIVADSEGMSMGQLLRNRVLSSLCSRQYRRIELVGGRQNQIPGHAQGSVLPGGRTGKAGTGSASGCQVCV